MLKVIKRMFPLESEGQINRLKSDLTKEKELRADCEDALIELAELFAEQDDAIVELAELIGGE